MPVDGAWKLLLISKMLGLEEEVSCRLSTIEGFEVGILTRSCKFWKRHFELFILKIFIFKSNRNIVDTFCIIEVDSCFYNLIFGFFALKSVWKQKYYLKKWLFKDENPGPTVYNRYVLCVINFFHMEMEILLRSAFWKHIYFCPSTIMLFSRDDTQ